MSCDIFCWYSFITSSDVIQGISYWSVKSKSALTDRWINNYIELWCLVGSGTGIGHLGTRDIPTSGWVNFLMKWGCQGHWGHWGHWGCRGFKAWKITTEDFSHPGHSALFWCFENNLFGLNHEISCSNFSPFSVGGCWGQLILLFWKVVDETQMSKSPEATRHLNSRKILILLLLRAIYNPTFQYETPCM